MINTFQSLLRSPTFEDEDKHRAAVLLHFILAAGILITFLSLVNRVLARDPDSARFVRNLITLAIEISLLMVMRKGRVREAGFILVAAGWLIIFAATFTTVGVLNPAFGAFTLVIVCAGLLINGWAAVVFAGLSIAYGLWLVRAAEAGLYPVQIGDFTAQIGWTSNTSVFILTGLFIFLSQRSVTEAHERSLRDRNAMRRSEERFRALIERSNDVVAILNLDQTIQFASPSIEPILGYKPEELLGDSGLEFVYPDDLPIVQEALESTIRSPGAVQTAVFREPRKDGGIAVIEASFSNLAHIPAIGGIVINARDITERTRMEQEIRASEEQYRLLFQNNPHPMYVLDLKSLEFLAVNDATVNSYGYSHNEFLTMTSKDIRPPDSMAAVAQQVSKFQGQRLDYDVTGPWQHRKKDGSVIRVETAAHRLTYKERDAVIIAAYDLTERLLAEEAVQRSEALLSQVFQAMPAAIVIVRLDDGRIVRVNDYFLKMLGYDEDEVIDRLISDVASPVEFREELLRQIHQKGSAHDLETEWKTKTGERLDILISGESIEIDGTACILEIAVNITARKRAEAAVKRSEELFSKIFESVPIVIGISTAQEGRLLNVNDYGLSLIGYEADELIGRLTSEVKIWSAPLRDNPDVVKALQETGAAHNIEANWITKSGDTLDMVVSLQPIEIEGELCLLTIAVDDTERKRIRKEHLENERMQIEVYKEREILELKERFIATMSHEFRTPLAVILASNDSLEHYYERMTPERRQQHFENVNKQVRYVTDLLDEVLTLSKAQAGKMPFNPAVLDLATFCERLFEQMQMTDSVHHRFTFVQDGQLGAVASDENLLQHILVNLLSNAIKYSPEGGEVRFELARVGNEAVIRMSDEGIGIPENDQRHLFEPFYRASNTKSIKGTGLGLAIVKESVETHGGTIVCESAAGKGTTFIVRLPVDSKVTT